MRITSDVWEVRCMRITSDVWGLLMTTSTHWHEWTPTLLLRKRNWSNSGDSRKLTTATSSSTKRSGHLRRPQCRRTSKGAAGRWCANKWPPQDCLCRHSREHRAYYAQLRIQDSKLVESGSGSETRKAWDSSWIHLSDHTSTHGATNHCSWW